ncbi:MAG: ribosomal protein L31E [Litorivivens sp.]
MDIQLEDLMTFAQAMNIKKAKQIIKEVKTVVGKWEDYANEASVDTKLRDEIWNTFPSVI